MIEHNKESVFVLWTFPVACSFLGDWRVTKITFIVFIVEVYLIPEAFFFYGDSLVCVKSTFRYSVVSCGTETNLGSFARL